MKIAVNTRLLLHNRLEGIGVFSYETLKRLSASHPDHEFYFLFDRPYNQEFIFGENVFPYVIKPQARHPILFYYWFEYALPRVLKKIKPDVFLSPDGFLSLSIKEPSVAVIHDLNFEHYPKAIPSWIIRKYYQRFFPLFVKKATRIVTVSNYSKRDIINSYHTSAEKIDVCYNGVSNGYQPLGPNEIKSVQQQYANGCAYFLYVGSLNPRKNITNLLLAYDQLRKSHLGKIKLLLVGTKMWWTGEMEETYQNLQYREDVIFTGRLAQWDLKNVMAAALSLVYVPFFEGFGIPIVEAFASGTPVITSKVSAMPEIAGDAAILVDPFSVNDIAKEMQSIFDETLRKSLIDKGLERSKIFSWDKTAQQLWESILKAVESIQAK